MDTVRSYVAKTLVAPFVIGVAIVTLAIAILHLTQPIQPAGGASSYFAQATMLNEFYESLPSFFKTKAMTDEEIQHFGRALRVAKPCPICLTMWEANGDSEPLVADVHVGGANTAYAIVVGEIRRIKGSKEVYTPRFIVYEYYQMGGASRVDEEGNVFLLIGDRWIPQKNEDASRIKARAFDALNRV